MEGTGTNREESSGAEGSNEEYGTDAEEMNTRKLSLRAIPFTCPCLTTSHIVRLLLTTVLTPPYPSL